MSEASTERPHLTMAEPGDLTDDEKARRAHITEQLEGIAARFEERNSDLFPDGTGERAPVHQAADQWIAQFAQLGATLTDLGRDYEGSVTLVGKITWDAKAECFVATAKCESHAVKTIKRAPAATVMAVGYTQGEAQGRLFEV